MLFFSPMAGTLGYGRLIREACEQKGWTQVDLGERVGEAASTISNWENERVRPSIEQGNELVLALALSAEAFWRSMGVKLTAPAVTKLPRQLLHSLLVRDLLTAADIAAEIGVDAVTVRRRAEALGLGRRVGHAIVFDITDVVRLREPRTPGWPKGRRRTVEPG